MVKVLIVDSSKASTVMSAEAFKEKISGVKILTAASGKEGLNLAREEKPDMCLIDFDLPDADGISMVQTLRQSFKGPIFLSVYPDEVATMAIRTELFAFNDSGDFLTKPLASKALGEKIEHFIVNGKRIGKRFDVNDLDIKLSLIAKAEGRGKRAPKFLGNLKTLSLGGASFELCEGFSKVKLKSEMTLSIQLPKVYRGKILKSRTKNINEFRIKVAVAWKNNPSIGVEFARLTDIQQKDLEDFLRASQL